jgi:predicted transcriptional regulator
MMNVRTPRRTSESVGELEAAVLAELWESGELATPAVFERVGRPKGLAYTTILTVLQRLHRKGLVRRREDGKSHRYEAAISRDVFAERRGQFLAGEIAALGPAGVAAFLAEVQRLDPKAVEAARKMLDGGP